MCPEGREQQQFSSLWFYLYILVGELCFATRSGHIVQVPDGDQLPLAEVVTAAINVPVIELARVGALYGIAAVFKRTLEKGIGFAKFLDGLPQ